MNDSYNIISRLYDLLKDEIKNSEKIYGENDAKPLINYYSKIIVNKDRFEYAKYYYTLRVMHLIKNIKKNTKILDIGCGTGTEAIFSGSLGAKVIGIDISDGRIRIAKKRVKYYEEKLNINLNIEFYLMDVFDYFDKFDIIWLNEAISHIAPLNKFFEFSNNILRKGKKLIIADTNRLNPYMFYLNKMEQKRYGGLYSTLKDPNTGKKIPYAVERCFTISEIKKLLNKKFKIDEIHTIGYFPFSIFRKFKKLCIKIENNFIKKLPIVKLFSGGYVIICSKLV